MINPHGDNANARRADTNAHPLRRIVVGPYHRYRVDEDEDGQRSTFIGWHVTLECGHVERAGGQKAKMRCPQCGRKIPTE